MRVRLSRAHGAVWAAAVDGKPLAEAGRILVTHLTDVQNTGVQWADFKHRIVLKRGVLPMMARKGKAEVRLAAALAAFSCIGRMNFMCRSSCVSAYIMVYYVQKKFRRTL